MYNLTKVIMAAAQFCRDISSTESNRSAFDTFESDILQELTAVNYFFGQSS